MFRVTQPAELSELSRLEEDWPRNGYQRALRGDPSTALWGGYPCCPEGSGKCLYCQRRYTHVSKEHMLSALRAKHPSHHLAIDLTAKKAS
jgi:hypothetical protein